MKKHSIKEVSNDFVALSGLSKRDFKITKISNNDRGYSAEVKILYNNENRIKRFDKIDNNICYHDYVHYFI